MKKILLISGKVLHYRILIYNVFYDRFEKLGYELHVLGESFQKVNEEMKFIKHIAPISAIQYARQVKKIDPYMVITFLSLKEQLIPIFFYCKLLNIPTIYWGHGCNLRQPNNFIKNLLFKIVHSISNAIILYTPDQLKYISTSNKKKTFIAYNTLDFSKSNKNNVLPKEIIKNKYNIKEKFVVLYISRIIPYKKMDVLLNAFCDNSNIAVVVVGSGINEEQLRKINNYDNLYYLGEKYNQSVDEIYNMGDVYSSPGHIGLSLNQAFFWGKPVIVLDKIHAPEIYYLKNGVNGYIVGTELELKNVIVELSENKKLYNEISKAAFLTGQTEISIDKMFEGFQQAIDYASN